MQTQQLPALTRIYLAGPMTGLPEHNYPAFFAAAAVLRNEGLEVINPADYGVVDGWDWADYMRRGLSLLSGCSEIVMLPGWSQSKGARLELFFADQLGMKTHLYGGAEWIGRGWLDTGVSSITPESALMCDLVPGRERAPLQDDQPDHTSMQVLANIVSTGEVTR